jgi:hypothetical protein
MALGHCLGGRAELVLGLVVVDLVDVGRYCPAFECGVTSWSAENPE